MGVERRAWYTLSVHALNYLLTRLRYDALLTFDRVLTSALVVFKQCWQGLVVLSETTSCVRTEDKKRTADAAADGRIQKNTISQNSEYLEHV